MNVERSAPKGAVFLSYARDDADAARRIADALRAFGVEVWFDQNELRGGEAWDAKIKKQIRECALFLAVISATTQERGEGYFRREWKLAVERTHDMSASRAFLVPVVIDDTTEAHAEVPEEFMRVQWTRLPRGVPTPQFVEQVRRLLESPKRPDVGRDRLIPPSDSALKAAGSGDPALQRMPVPTSPGRRLPTMWIVLAVFVVAAALLWWLLPRHGPAETTMAPGAAASPPVPRAVDAKSIAVLPFANMSDDKGNGFFVDGVHDEVITALAKIHDLKVISRTSVMAYRDPAGRNLKKIAAELNVGTVLEGSVQRAGNKVHLNAQLIDARTDEHLWADTFDGDASDIFALQAKLAQQIASALKATLTPDERTLIERRPTQNQEAYELYQQARSLQQDLGETGAVVDYEHILGIYEQAIQRDPSFALAESQAAIVHSILYWFGNLDPTPARAEKMKRAVDAAVAAAPNAPETHLALGAYHYRVERDWRQALAEFRLAEAGLPNDSQLMFWLALAHRRLGDWTDSIGYFDRSIALNPRDLAVVTNYVAFLAALRRFEPCRAASARFLAFFPGNRDILETQAKAGLAVANDREAYARAIERLPLRSVDSSGLADRVLAALLRDDLAAADRLLAGVASGTVTERTSTVISDPWEFFQAEIAFLRGDREAARRRGDEAIAFYRAGRWNERQRPWADMRIAQAAAWAGRTDEALREARKAMADVAAHDAYDATVLREISGQVSISLGRNDEAIACLREMLAGPCSSSPNALRIDPFWSRLKADPRFEEILQSARPL